MIQYLQVVISLMGHYGRPYLAEAHSVPPAFSVEDKDISLPFNVKC